MVDRIEELNCWLDCLLLEVVPALTRLLVRAELCLRLLLLLLLLLWWMVRKLLSRNIVGGPRPLTIHQCDWSAREKLLGLHHLYQYVEDLCVSSATTEPHVTGSHCTGLPGLHCVAVR